LCSETEFLEKAAHVIQPFRLCDVIGDQSDHGNLTSTVGEDILPHLPR
jgi:hypothetical protein